MTHENDAVVDEALANSRKLMSHMADAYPYPIDALMACVLSLAVLAHGVGMPLDVLIDGISKAYDGVETGKKGIVQ